MILSNNYDRKGCNNDEFEWMRLIDRHTSYQDHARKKEERKVRTNNVCSYDTNKASKICPSKQHDHIKGTACHNALERLVENNIESYICSLLVRSSRTLWLFALIIFPELTISRGCVRWMSLCVFFVGFFSWEY